MPDPALSKGAWEIGEPRPFLDRFVVGIERPGEDREEIGTIIAAVHGDTPAECLRRARIFVDAVQKADRSQR